MSADCDKETACPTSEKQVKLDCGTTSEEQCERKPQKALRNVSFPDDGNLVTQYFEPANPWQDVPPTDRAQLAAEYLEYCRKHSTPPIECVLDQIRELPDSAIGGCARAPRLTLADCALVGCAPCDALEALLARAQFRRLELRDAGLDDEAAEALFDMIEYYESAIVLSIGGPRQFGIRGWQACSRLIKKSAELTELEITEAPISAAHATVLARALRAHTCRLFALCLTSACLSGDPLLSPTTALRSNTSLRELRLGDNRLSAADAAQLAHLLKVNTHIQLLDLSNNLIQDAGVGHIADALVHQAATAAGSPQSPVDSAESPETRGLAVLVLWNNQLTRNCVHHLSRALRASTSLTVLNIGRNSCGPPPASLGCGRLASLGLQGAGLGGGAGGALAALLRPPMQRLDLRDNKLGSAGLEPILAALKEHKYTNIQIDLDDPPDNPADPEYWVVSRLTTEIRAACAGAASTAGRTPRAHRKISLTCRTNLHYTATPPAEERKSRLRSPAPSPAPSPVPPPASRFSVTRVTPERESSSESLSPSTPILATSPTHSRFTVRTVAEPPSIKVHTPPEPRKCSSRFSVTRNYDSVYNPTPVPSPPPDVSPTTTPPPPKIDENIIQMKLQENTRKVEQDVDTSSKVDQIVYKTRQFDKNCEKSSKLDQCLDKSCKVDDSKVDKLDDQPADRSTDRQTKIKTDDIKEDRCTIEVLKLMPVPKPRGTPAIVIQTDNVSSENKPDDKSIQKKEEKQDAKKDEVVTQTKGDQPNSGKEVHKETNTLVDNKRLSSDRECVNKNIECKNEDASACKPNDKCKQTDKCVSSIKSDNEKCFSDKTEQLTHSAAVSDVSDGTKLKTETKLVKNSTEVRDNEKVDVQVEVVVVKESVHNVNTPPAKVHSDQNIQSVRIDSVNISSEKSDVAMKQIEAITEDLGNLIQEMKELSTKTVSNKKDVKFKTDCTQTDDGVLDNCNLVPANVTRDNVVLKKNRSESSLDSPDLEVSRLMNKKLVASPFCDSSSSLEISGSSMESLNALEQLQITMKPIVIQESVESDSELDRRKIAHIGLSTESSMESNTSELTPANNSNLLNMSLSSNESVSPIIFGKNKKLHGSLSSLEASVSSLESRQDKVMVTSADSGIEHSLQNPSESREDTTSNEGTLTLNSSLKETVDKPDCFQVQETLTSSPKRTSSLLDVPAAKNKGVERTRKISWVAPSPSFHVPKPEPEKCESKLTSLEKLLSIFQHPTSLFSKNQSDEERKSASNTPPRKDSSLTSSFWSWGSSTDKPEKEEREDSPSEHTDSTLSERVQVSYVDESFSKKLDSKTPSTDTDNTLSEFQSFPVQASSETSETSQADDKKPVTHTTDDELVQTCLDLSLKCVDNASSNGNKTQPGTCDITDLIKPNDFNKNVYELPSGEVNKNAGQKDDSERLDKATDTKVDEAKIDPVRPRSFAAVLKASGSENSLEKQTSPEGQSVDKLPSKVIRGIKENISPENTLTSSMTNTKTLAYELADRQMKTHTVVNALWEVTLDKCDTKHEDSKAQGDMAPIATIEETSDETADQLVHIPLEFIDDTSSTIDDEQIQPAAPITDDSSVDTKKLADVELHKAMENVDLGKDALSYLIFENQNFESTSQTDVKTTQGSLAEELKEAENKEKLVDLSPELIIDDAAQVPEVFTSKDTKGKIIPERAKLKKSNSLEDIAQRPAVIEKDPTKKIAFIMPEISTTTPRDIPEPRTRMRTRSGSSPKSLPESLNKPSPLSRMECGKKKKKVSSLGKMAKDSLLALNVSEDEIAEFRPSYITSVESLRSLESVSEDANSQSGHSLDSRCRACLRTSQESLMSLDSINEDCKCGEECTKSHSAR